MARDRGLTTVDMLIQGVAYYSEDKNYLENLMHHYTNTDDRNAREYKEMHSMLDKLQQRANTMATSHHTTWTSRNYEG
eukprot:6492730-Amphidinium_carterae.4